MTECKNENQALKPSRKEGRKAFLIRRYRGSYRIDYGTDATENGLVYINIYEADKTYSDTLLEQSKHLKLKLATMASP